MNLTARIAATFNRSGLPGSVFGRRSAAVPAATPASVGVVRTHIKLLAFLAISLLSLFATAASASAAPPTTTAPVVSDVSYSSAHLTGKITTSGGLFDNTPYTFQYSTSESGPWTNGPGGEISGDATEKERFGDLEGLEGGTKYYVRLVASVYAPGFVLEEGVSPEPNPSLTTLTADPPTIPGLVTASPVFSLSAKVSAKVIRPTKSDDVKCHFEYISDEQFKANELASAPPFQGAPPAVDCAQNPIKQADADTEKEVKADLTGLTPNTTYHLRFVAENAAPGVVIKDSANFTTAPKVSAPTVTATDAATEVNSNSAKFTGKVLRPAGDDPALDVNCHFEYVADAAFQPLSEQQKLTLTNATGGTYTLSYAGESTGPIAFDASAAQVQSALESLSSIGAGNLSVSGSYTIDFTGSLAGKDVEQIFADPSGLEEAGVASAETTTPTEGHVGGFESPKTADCEQNTITAAKVDEDGEIDVSAKAVLAANTKYHLRLVAENEGGTDTKDALNTFTTPEAEKPVVTIDPVEDGTFTTAHVSGTVDIDDPGHPISNVRIEFSTDNVSWSGIELPQPSGAGPHVVETNFSGLQPSTTYFFRIASKYSSNSWADGEANGEVAFSPLPNPEITTEPPQEPPTAENLEVTGVTATTAHFSGTVNTNAPAGPLSGPAKKAYETKWHFECTPECKDRFGNEIGGTVEGEEGPQPVAADLEGLEPNTDYTVSLVVSSGIPGEPAVKTFLTLKSPPSVKQTLGSSDGTGGYTLQGVVNPNKETITDCKFQWGPKSNELVFGTDCSPMPKPGAKPTTVEAHLTGLTLNVDYYSQLVVTYGAGLEENSGGLVAFKASLATKEPCPGNEQQRIENSSLDLPECRAYEMVTPPGKEGFGAGLETFDGGAGVAYTSEAGNIAKSGQNSVGAPNRYVAVRTEAGWQTIPNLNGSSGSLFDAPSNVDSPGVVYLRAYSHDLLSSIWQLHRLGESGGPALHLRGPDGTYTPISPTSLGSSSELRTAASSDLSHLVTWNSEWGPSVYEFLGTGMDQPRRVDLDNSGTPISSCIDYIGNTPVGIATFRSISADGSRIVVNVNGAQEAKSGTCGVGDPPTDELWARINGTTAVDVSASHCSRPDCNAPANANFAAATPDGSRVFFTTTQQLVNADTDQANDIYACDIPSGTPSPMPGKANPCAAFRQVSAGDHTSAAVESIDATSENGDTVLFTAKGALVDNKDALGEKAVAGDHNLYVWRTDASHPDGQTTFVARLDSNDLVTVGSLGQSPQATPDGRYLVFTTASPLLDTDTDSARDVYRYDADSDDLIRVSTNVFGVAGNGDFDAQISRPVEHHPTTAISDDGTKIVFTTTEPLKLAVDNNDEPDVYLWTPSHVSLISTGSSGFAPRNKLSGGVLNPAVAIDPSGEDIYFESAQALTPADGDGSTDIYDTRIGGGFSFAQPPICSGEKCQPDPIPAPPTKTPLSALPGPGNPPQPKPCPKGKIRNKKGKCVKKPKKHPGKKHHGKKASHKQGGGK